MQLFPKAEHIEGRPVVRTIPKLNPRGSEGRPTLPSGIFTANTARLVLATIVFNLSGPSWAPIWAKPVVAPSAANSSHSSQGSQPRHAKQCFTFSTLAMGNTLGNAVRSGLPRTANSWPPAPRSKAQSTTGGKPDAPPRTASVAVRSRQIGQLHQNEPVDSG